MNDDFYSLLMRVFNPILWGGKLLGEEYLPKHGPAVFVANHLDSRGPIALQFSIPLRLYTWLQGEMLDKKEAVAYLQKDVFEHQLHLKPPVSRWLSWMCCKISVPMLRSFGCIPVYEHHYKRLLVTLQLTVNILREGKYVAIFPEDSRPPAVPDPETKIYPFQHSFVRLAEDYFKETGKSLVFYPVAVHPAGFVEVGNLVAYDPHELRGREFHRIKDTMEREIRDMYLKMDAAKVCRKKSLTKKEPTVPN
jgi:hypothetical protein